MSVAELTVLDDLDLELDLTVFSTPGGGVMAGDPGEEEEDPKGPITYGTTCWGTPCPSANTVSC